MARLASYIADIDVFTIEITKQYRLAEWHEDIKHLFEKTGVYPEHAYKKNKLKIKNFLIMI